MNRFVFHNPVAIRFGRGVVDRIGDTVALYGRRVLLVYGRGSIKQHGLYDRVHQALADAGVTVVEHGGVHANPLLSHVRAGIELAKTARTEAVVAVGGGSVIDSAKAIAAGAVAKHDVWLFFRGKKGIKEALPVICAPTVVGAGSETNSGMVLTHDEQRLKLGIGNRLLLPKAALLDPTVTITVPPHQTAYGATDALAHLLEFYCTGTATFTPVQDHLAAGVMRTIMASSRIAVQEPANYAARADLMWSAVLALHGLISAGRGRVGLPAHLLAHPLSALYDLPHGAAVAAVLPGWLCEQANENPSRLANFAEQVFSLRGNNRHAIARQGITMLADWLQTIGCPVCLADLGIDAKEIPALAENARPLAKLWRLADYPPERCQAIFHKCLLPHNNDQGACSRKVPAGP